VQKVGIVDYNLLFLNTFH